jgi:hypothetical protein
MADDSAVPRIPDIHLAQHRFTVSRPESSESARKAAVDELVKGVERDGKQGKIHLHIKTD